MSDFAIGTRLALVMSCAVTAVTAWTLVLAAPAAASEPETVCAAGVCSESYEETGSPQSFTVPALVTSLTLEVSGAGGGGGFGAPGGNGARLAARFPVAPGSTLALVVGQRGEFNSGGYGGGGRGGFAPFEEGMGGGGASFVFSEAGLLIAAGGGGGAGGTSSGGAGAWNGVNGSISVEAPFWEESESGRGGKQTGGGEGGTGAQSGGGPTETPAIEGAGGQGASGRNGGGGGGGGYYGGGGGGSQGFGPWSNGGGGGGADFLSGAGEDASFENGGGGQGGPGALYGGFMGVSGDIVVSWRQLATSVTVKASARSVPAGGHELYTASVTPAPSSGTVTFADGESPIEGCEELPVEAGSARCSVTYTATGAHAVTASYSGSSDHLLLASSAATPASVYVEPEAAAPEAKTVTPATSVAPASGPPAKAPLLVSRGAAPVLTAHALSLNVRCGSSACKVRPNVWITIAGRSWQLPVKVAGARAGYVTLLVTVPATARRGLRALMAAHPRWHAFVNVLLGEPGATAGQQLTSMGQLAAAERPATGARS